MSDEPLSWMKANAEMNPQKPIADPRDDGWSWLDPFSDARFLRTEPAIQQGGGSQTLLRNLVRLADQIFDHLSVFEQFSHASSRGAVPDLEKRIRVANVRNGLASAEQELWRVYCALREARKSFVKDQLDSLGINDETRNLKVHIGAASHPLDDWLNIDAGGGDLMLNVNWGLQLPDGCAAFVYCAHLLEHLRYHDQAPVFAREVHRILREGGTVRFVVPDAGKLLAAYAKKDREFFASRQMFYRLSKGFIDDGVASLDYILMFCGAGPQQVLSFNHKFGYDSVTLCKLLTHAGFSRVVVCNFEGSKHPELRVDHIGYNAQARDHFGQHYSLFVEATK